MPTLESNNARRRSRPVGARTCIEAAVLLVLLCQLLLAACHRADPNHGLAPLVWPAWIEDGAVKRGHVQAGDLAQFGCPPGWMGVDETAAALRGRDVSTTYVGSEPPRHEATITCVAQKDFALPSHVGDSRPAPEPIRRPLTPVWLSTTGDGITIGFARELPPDAPVYLGQDTPCGPRLIGVELKDLLRWLADPDTGRDRHFLGMISAGCPEERQRF